MKGSKLAGVLVASAIVGLSLGDALTGHGIKGNKNLNPIVVGDGSSSSGSGSSSSGNSGSGSGSGSSSSDSGSSSSSSGEEAKGYAVVCAVDGGTTTDCIEGKEVKCDVTYFNCDGKGRLACPPSMVKDNCTLTGRDCNKG